MALLEVDGLAVRYGYVTAVRNFRAEVGAGQIVVVLGANGAGKTSLLRAIAGLEAKAEGQVHLNGKEITLKPAYKIARAGLALVPEGRRIFSPLSVEDNLRIGGYTQRSKRSRNDALQHVYDLFPVLADRRAGRAGLLSGGEQQMLAFGRALMAGPTLMMLDEPSMGLAPMAVDSIMESIGQIAESGIGVLLVEQNAAAALELASTAIVMERGDVVINGPANNVRRNPGLAEAFLGGHATGVGT